MESGCLCLSIFLLFPGSEGERTAVICWNGNPREMINLIGISSANVHAVHSADALVLRQLPDFAIMHNAGNFSIAETG